MRFSAWFFGSLRRNFFSCLVLFGLVAPRGAVPFIGCVSIQPSASISKNSSGERDSTTGSPRSTSAPYFTGWRAISASKADERIAGPSGLDREGQVRLVAVALAQMPVHAVEALSRSRRTTRSACASKIGPLVGGGRCCGSGSSDGPSKTPKHIERRAAPSGAAARASARADSRPRRRNSRPAICRRRAPLRRGRAPARTPRRVARDDDARAAARTAFRRRRDRRGRARRVSEAACMTDVATQEGRAGRCIKARHS